MKDKREDIRIPLISEVVAIRADNYFDQLFLTDVSNKGVFVKVTRDDQLLKPRTAVTLHFELPGDLGVVSVDAEVARVNWLVDKKKTKEKGMALKFKELTPSIQKIWDAYRVYLRNKQIITVSKRIIEEFFSPKGPRGVL